MCEFTDSVFTTDMFPAHIQSNNSAGVWTRGPSSKQLHPDIPGASWATYVGDALERGNGCLKEKNLKDVQTIKPQILTTSFR